MHKRLARLSLTHSSHACRLAPLGVAGVREALRWNGRVPDAPASWLAGSAVGYIAVGIHSTSTVYCPPPTVPRASRSRADASGACVFSCAAAAGRRRSAAIGALALGTTALAVDSARAWADAARVRAILEARAPPLPSPTTSPPASADGTTDATWWTRMWRMDQAPIRPMSDAEYRTRLREQIAAIEDELATRQRSSSSPAAAAAAAPSPGGA